MKYFNATMDIKELRSLFHKFCISMHPDKGGNHNDFIDMKNEYDYTLLIVSGNEREKAFKENREPFFNFESEKEIAEMIQKIVRVKGIIVEICGSWIWLTGNTFPVHDTIHAFGFKFSRQKKAWYFSPYMAKKKVKGRYNMNKIRSTFGSVIIESNDEEKLIAA